MRIGMKKLMFLSLMISLFAFGNKSDVRINNAQEAVSATGTSATFYNGEEHYLSNIVSGFSPIASIKVSNKTEDLPTNPVTVVALPNCTYTDASGNESVPEEGVIFAYVSNASDSTEENLRYDMVLYANVDKIYLNQDASYMFHNFELLEKIDLHLLDTSKCTDMSDMFLNDTSLTSLDLSNFDTSSVINMDGMFSGCNSLTELNVSNFNTSKVGEMYGMFGGCKSLTELDITNFDTSNVKNFGSIFANCESLTTLDVSKLNTSNAINMFGMFYNCVKLKSVDVSNFDTRNATNMASMFFGCKSLTKVDVSKFNTSNVKNMYGMFYLCISLSSIDVTNFDTSNVQNMEAMFFDCASLKEIDVSTFNTSNVKTMRSMFLDCRSLIELNLTNFVTTKVTDMSSMFSGCTALRKLDISSFDMTHSCDYADSNSFSIEYKKEEFLLKKFLKNCTKLEYFKAPIALPAKSVSDTNYAISVPSQFAEYYSDTVLTSDNLSSNQVLDIRLETFVNNWKALRTEGGENGICSALVSGTSGNKKLTQLLADYDGFYSEIKESIDAYIDEGDTTIGETITYVKNVIDGKQTTEGNYNGIKDDTGSFMTISLTEESPYLIAVISLIGILSVVGYFFYNKKKQAM